MKNKVYEITFKATCYIVARDESAATAAMYNDWLNSDTDGTGIPAYEVRVNSIQQGESYGRRGWEYQIDFNGYCEIIGWNQADAVELFADWLASGESVPGDYGYEVTDVIRV